MFFVFIVYLSTFINNVREYSNRFNFSEVLELINSRLPIAPLNDYVTYPEITFLYPIRCNLLLFQRSGNLSHKIMIFFWFSIEDWPRIFDRSIDLSSIECNNTLFVAICRRKDSQNCTRKIFVKLIQLYKRVIQILPGLKIVLSRQFIYIRHLLSSGQNLCKQLEKYIDSDALYYD